jgi:hypothetical protein
MAVRKAKGEVPEATHKLLNLKHGDYVRAQLEAGSNPWVLADALSNDPSEVTKDVEKRDRSGKVTGMDEITIGPLRVTADQLQQWYPDAYAAGEPEAGHEEPDKGKQALDTP